jgi:molybdate transport system substrate-binding protein
MKTFAWLLLALSILSCTTEPHEPVLTVAAASSLRPAVDPLVTGWTGEHPDRPVRVVYAASGTLYAQIEQNAPFDLFLSADTLYTKRVVESGRAHEVFHYATGTLALWISATTGETVRSIEDLAKPSVGRIAIASPDLAPYGVAAVEVLRRKSVYDAVRDEIVFGANAGELAQMISSGAVDAALLPLSIASLPPIARRGRYQIIPPALHEPILHHGTILARSSANTTAEEFVDYLLSEKGRDILKAAGFTVPDPSPVHADE